MKILLVDDERQLVDALSVILKQHKYSVDCAFDGDDGLSYALTGLYDVIVLDIMMPKMNGLDVLKQIRLNKIDVPILMLTAKSEISDKIEGLNRGADDYLTKPFNTDEFLARIRALLRRKETYTGNVLTYNDISLDRDSFLLIKGVKNISLGKKEFQILEHLMLSSGKTIDKEYLIEKIWGFDSEAEYNTIEVYVSFLRRKLLAVNSTTEIKSVRGIGYTLGVKND